VALENKLFAIGASWIVYRLMSFLYCHKCLSQKHLYLIFMAFGTCLILYDERLLPPDDPLPLFLLLQRAADRGEEQIRAAASFEVVAPAVALEEPSALRSMPARTPPSGPVEVGTGGPAPTQD
jgi:hypothetical protein